MLVSNPQKSGFTSHSIHAVESIRLAREPAAVSKKVPIRPDNLSTHQSAQVSKLQTLAVFVQALSMWPAKVC